MVGISARRIIQEQSSLAGFRLEEGAVKVLLEWLQQGGSEGSLQQVFSTIDSSGSLKATAAQIQHALDNMYGTAQEQDLIQVISAFDVPKVLYDPMRKCFYRPDAPPKLLGNAQDKMDLYINRFYLLHQRLRRMKGWYKPAIIDATNQNYVELTELKAMLGMEGETRIVMGCITQTEDGRYSLEDLSACMPLDISEAEIGDGFITENCVVVAEGQLQHNGSFRATALGLPPVESREASVIAAKGLDFFGGTPLNADDLLRAAQWESSNEEERIVVLSNVWLDRPQTLDRLGLIMAGFESLEDVPKLFVLMGNFHSGDGGGGSHSSLRENFNALAALMRPFKRIAEQSRLVFVPGPDDPGPGTALPRPPLPSVFTEKLAEELPNAVFTSNPARVRYGTQQLVLFRADCEAKMRRLCLVPPRGEKTPEAMFHSLAMTLLQQSHLSPVPLEVQPTYWQADHALSLYPLPHLLVIADASTPAATATFEGCQCLNPGSFADGSFAAYIPCARETELCDVPDEK